MSTNKSQHPLSRRLEDRASTTRLPQPSITPTMTKPITAGVPISSQPKLQKRRPSLEQQLYSRKPMSQKGLAQDASRSLQPATSGTISPNVQQASMVQRRPIPPSSTSRLPRLDAPMSIRTPSLVGSSTSTIESPRSNVLRRKQTSVGVVSSRRGPRIKDNSMSPQDGTPAIDGFLDGYKDPFSETVMGVPLPNSSTIPAVSDPRTERCENGFYDCDVGPKDLLPPPTPQYPLSVTPSTRYSESPGAFSTSSTPTSMSSYSPGTSLSSRTSVRTKQTSPLNRHRTPDESNNRHPHTLPTVRESSTSSSSTSTVIAEAKQKEREPTSELAALPQSPRILDCSLPVKKPPTQAPPELAHLAGESPVSLSASRRPSIPSRYGTPDVNGLRGPSPVVRGNTVNVTSSHGRNSSAESKFAQRPAMNARSNEPLKPSSRLSSPNPSSSLAPVTRLPTRGATPDISNDQGKRQESTVSLSATEPSSSKPTRFGFFSRRTKTEPALPVSKSDSKLRRRGPAAGTGHEGYGIHAFRGRSRSSVRTASIGNLASAATTAESLNQTPSTRKSSMTSTASTDREDFFLSRLTPVVLRGTGSSTELSHSPEPILSRSSIDLSAHLDRDQKNVFKHPPHNKVKARERKLSPSAIRGDMRAGSPVQKKEILGQRRPSGSEDDINKASLPTSVSNHTSRALPLSQGPTVITAPMSRTPGQGRKNSISNIVADVKEGGWLKSSKKSKPGTEQVKPSKRWNFFQRAHATPHVATKVVTVTSPAPHPSPSRSVAHYALIDQSGLDMTDIEQLMQEAITPDEGTESSAHSDEEARVKERLQSPLLPPKPILPYSSSLSSNSASPQVSLRPGNEKQHSSGLEIKTDLPLLSAGHYSTADLTPFTDLSPPSSPLRSLSPLELEQVRPHEGPSSPSPPPISPLTRPNRLPRVGRIPQVVSSRRQMHCPSPQSFSRPFVATQPRLAAPRGTSFDSIGAFATTPGPAEPYPILHGLNALTHGSAIASISPFDELTRQSQFFKLSPRKNSDVSYSSSSGVWSFTPTAGTAVVPESGSPLSEDELWNEYDDLIDEVLLPVTSLHTEDATMVRSQHPSLEPLPLNTKTLCVSSPSGQPDMEVPNPSLHLRRSRLLAVLHSSQSPVSSVSFSDFLSEYGEKKISVIDPITGRLSLPTSPSVSTTGSNAKPIARSGTPVSLPPTARQSKGTVVARSSSGRHSLLANRSRDSRTMEFAETQVDGFLSMANLRFGSLMTSKWLSFGRVLFSPVHFRLKDPSEDRVLVIDGLGKDWSYYCALTYPKATVYNMSTERSLGISDDDSPESGSTLNNHRHINHSSLKMAFPFPMHFFASVVLRFPTALPSPQHQFVLSEAKRVLRPGGYLEFSVLDMDLVNMGDRARRAVRGLKMRMQEANENTSLRNISDEIMAGIGRKGFVECNRCVVGVPVAGKLPQLDDAKSTNTTTTTTKSKSSTASSSSQSAVPLSNSKAPGEDLSFSELLRLSSDSTDTGITDMVARVGRWWYSRCYESIALPKASELGTHAAGSIWCDDRLIQECEKRGTSFKLLIGYAQKPTLGVRRTASV